MEQLNQQKATQSTTTVNLQSTPRLIHALDMASKLLLSQQSAEGYWWYTLEANEAIGAEFIQLMHFLDAVDEEIQHGIINRMMAEQREDGSWGLYYSAPGDISIGIECYFVMKLAGVPTDHPVMVKARKFILSQGGLTQVRVFTRIHLALFGIIPWSTCPAMPSQLMLAPKWAPLNIYEFSSWARASIVPLLVVMSKRPVKRLPDGFNIDELYCEGENDRAFGFKAEKSFISWGNSLIQLDKFFKLCQRLPIKPLKDKAIQKALEWTTEHIEKTEDIYPAMAYAAMAYKAAGYDTNSPEIQRCLNGLKGFQHKYTDGLSCLPESCHSDPPQAEKNPVSHAGSFTTFRMTQSTCHSDPPQAEKNPDSHTGSFVNTQDDTLIHQQCCISPVWDTPWALYALLEAGIPADHPALLKAGRWLISKQILFDKADWKIKNPHGEPGGWSFEFKNDFFPDVDDTIEVLTVLHRIAIPEKEKAQACERGLNWLLSMQNDDGGWGAFDKNNNLEIVNKIPFSDHGACLDPSSPDITARMIEFLASRGFSKNDHTIKRALNYIKESQEFFICHSDPPQAEKNPASHTGSFTTFRMTQPACHSEPQEKNPDSHTGSFTTFRMTKDVQDDNGAPLGGWFGRWGVNYIYGTWAVLTALAAIEEDLNQDWIQKAVTWLKGIQNTDGGWSESPQTYVTKKFEPYPESVPSQTAWALMGLIATGEAKSDEAKRGADFLMNHQNEDGSWDEKYFTGTGFPGHFYIRYHGYRHFFPTLALAKYSKAINNNQL